MKPLAGLVVVMVLGVACAACSHSEVPAQPAQSASPPPPESAPPPPPPASAIPMTAPASGGSMADPAAAHAGGPTLYQMMQRPGFAGAFDAMDGAASLPAWARHGGVALPVQRVTVDGQPRRLAQTCEAQGCQTGTLLLLMNPSTRSMQGLLVQVSGSAGARVRQLKWLGKPDPAAQAFLQSRLARD